MAFKGEVSVRRWKAAVQQFPSILYREMAPQMDRLRLDFEGKMKLNRMSGPAPAKLMPRTGHGRRSLKSMRFGSTMETLGVRWYFDRGEAPYIGSHEPPPRSSLIRPVKAKMLAIPLRDAKTGAGVVRGEYAVKKGGTLRTIPGLFLLKPKAGGLFLVKRVGGELKFLFVLKARVRVRRRLGFRKYLRDQSVRLMRYLKKGLRRAEEAFRAKKR